MEQPNVPAAGAPEVPSLRKQRVGDWLVELNLISSRQLAEAMQKQTETGERLGTLLVQLGYLTERELGDVLLLQETLASHASLTDFPVDRDLLPSLNLSFARQHKVMPLLLVGKRLLMAVTDRNNHEVIELASLMTGYMIIPVNFRHQDIEAAIGYFYEGVLPQANAAADTSGTVLRKQRLGDWLVDLNLISKPQLAEAMELQKITGERIGALLVQLGYLTDRELNDVLLLQEMLASHASLTAFPVDKQVLRLLNESFCKQNQVLSLVLVGQRLVVALPDRNNAELIDRISLLSGYKIIPIAFRKPDLDVAIAHFFSPDGHVASSLERVVQAAGADADQKKSKQNVTELVSDDDGTIVSLVNSIIRQAIESGVSDVHLESQERGLEVRMRLDGVMQKTTEIPPGLAAQALTRFKVLAGMNVTENRRPQDGRFTMRHKQDTFDFRASTIGSHWGETMVIRILRPLAVGNPEALGSDEETRARFKQILGAASGMVLVTGPTGSGKTSTLYACIAQLDRTRDSIVTIEDPVEFPLPGIVQIQIQSKIGLTFAAALRTILRQDPDTVMVGEIRDSEVLEAAVAAAMTGHLVLSTLHTNDAISTISRLMDMGAKPYQISSTVVGIVAQRLVRRVCKQCSEQYAASYEERQFLKTSADEPVTLARGKGCQACKNTGYRGRLAVYEILRINRRLKNLINANEPEAELWKAAREMGFRTLLEDARLRVRQGLTTVDEVMRVLGDGSLDE